MNGTAGRPARDEEFKAVYKLIPGRADQLPNGEFRSVGGTGSLATGGDAAVSVERSWSYFPDGRFARAGVAGASSSAVVTGGRQPPKAGRYHIDGYMIELRVDGGNVERLIFGLDRTGDLVCLGGDVYTRRTR